MTTVIARLFARVAALFAAALLLGAPAQADWHRAESERFVIYSDSRADDIKEFAERLERYHMAMAKLSGFNPPVPSPSNRVTVYAVGSDRTLKRLYGDTGSNVAGFYIPRAGDSVAFVPNVRLRGNETDFTLIVLMHECAHHFFLSATPYALPRWITEGSAEFFAAARFQRDGGVDLGLPAKHRVGDLNFADKLTIQEILDYDRLVADSGPRRDGFYGQAWLLFHYLMFHETRFAQYGEYAVKYLQGMPSLQAAEEAFGDLDQLEKELRAYQRKRRLPAQRLSAELLPIGEVTVSELSEGMNAMMDVILKSRRGVNSEEALDLLPEAREVAAEFPQDAGVLTALAEAEYDAGNDAEAIAAADRALALDPSRKNAYVQKGFPLFRMAREAENTEAAYERAMEPFAALNQMEPDHPLPLIHYYRSFVQRGVRPEENAKRALMRASELAPFDKGLRLNVGMMLIRERLNQEASATLAPLAADPHGSRSAEKARKLIAVLEQTPDGTPVDLSGLKGENDEKNAESGG